MKVFTVHLRARAAPVLLREGFSWGAALFGPLWLGTRGAWIPAAFALLAWAVLAVLPFDLGGRVVLALGLAWAQGLWGRDAVRWSLDRRDFVTAHVVAAADEDAAFACLLERRPDLAARALP